jgi:hypothetical protein
MFLRDYFGEPAARGCFWFLRGLPYLPGWAATASCARHRDRLALRLLDGIGPGRAAHPHGVDERRLALLLE